VIRDWEEDKNHNRIQTDRRGCGQYSDEVGMGTMVVGIGRGWE